MTDFRDANAGTILDAIQQYGPSGGASCLQKENVAAAQSIESGLYVTFIPQNTGDIINSEVRERYEYQHQQCCRVAMEAPCLCGHSLADHKAVNAKSKGFIIPPKCAKKGCNCFRYNYAPCRPEETGQWWLPRRKDFDLKSWRKVTSFISVLFCSVLLTLYLIVMKSIAIFVFTFFPSELTVCVCCIYSNSSILLYLLTTDPIIILP
jgi:hypothetical protein